jgi:hypothetical protein
VVWDEIEYYDAFNISHVHKDLNKLVDSLVTAATLFQPWATNPYITYMVEVYFHPFVPR